VKTDVQIRIAVPDDSEAIATVISKAFAEGESDYTPEAYAATVPEADEIRKRFDEGAIWVALKNEEIVGTISTVAENEKLYFRSMAVLPSAQGLGIGHKLLETVEKFAVENGFKSLFLYTTPFLASAVKLYEQNGFERGKAETEGFFGTPWFAMEKKLN
jgi:putative acetyltransferase